MRSRPYRWVTAAVGLLFIALAAAILFTTDSYHNLEAALTAFIVGGLGGDALVSPTRNRRPLLSCIGHLP
ncbi:hypothetical protein H6F55_16350 [Phormidium sp. FACHB-322]|nr:MULTISPECIES: hypothetical protein [unclassified Phormidium]MBD2031557.1 hypothetical protein [Phormidium sp. FACHB-322]